jgi:tryptophan halogenase
VELIEFPTIPIVGVGEATTLSTFVTFAQLNIDELDFLKHCDASFKASVKFVNWDVDANGNPRNYYHPFDAPPFMFNLPPAYHWHRRARAMRAEGRTPEPFASAMSHTPALMDAMRAPRSFDQGPFDGLVNYS